MSTLPCSCSRCLPEGGSLQAELEMVTEERNRLIDTVRELRAESARLRAALARIAEQATQQIDTPLAGRILRQIEQAARAALEAR